MPMTPFYLNPGLTTTAATTTNPYVWQQWTNVTQTSSTLVLPSNNVVWQGWIEVPRPNYGWEIATTNHTWQIWMNQPQQIVVVPTELSPEAIAAIARQQEEAIERQRVAAEMVRVRTDQIRQAQVKARKLLDYILTADQTAELEAHGRIHIRGSRGRRYCINARGQSGNVHYLDDAGKVVGHLCAHPRGSLPDPDAWLAQLLALQDNEDAFCAVANVHWGVKPTLFSDPLPV